ncbi:hypothetical protein JVT61DRAFT_851 [Boletus reticuloceps]|uniref:Uncharacterized protein n=1 Tax=Boletus reticuloceps TaxID=495285 RepID=A0A8I2Z1S9_9AGAM|nr:hypothetical protein JVT61DRAFT_851 [Boletus reticuloceps]
MLRKPGFPLPSRAYLTCSLLRSNVNPVAGNRIATMATEATRGAGKGGTIADVFTTLGPKADVAPLPARFSAVKKEVLRDMGVTPDKLELAWKGVLKALEPRVQEIISKGGNIIPRISYKEVKDGFSESQKDAIRKTGVVVITGGVPEEEALGWKCLIKGYIAANPVTGFPPENIQAYELYNSKPQIYARTHDSLLNTQKALLSLWHSSTSFPDSIDFTTPISYFDRLRIRTPGDRSFALGPHIDGGSVERWEDTAFRRVWTKILCGGQSGWESFDPFDATWRVNAKQDLYNAPYVWNPFSRVLILLSWIVSWLPISLYYPGSMFRRRTKFMICSNAGTSARSFGVGKYRHGQPLTKAVNVSLAAEDWEINLEGSEFPGSVPGKAQELHEATHPHLRLAETMVSIPKIDPGDQVYCEYPSPQDPDHTMTGKANCDRLIRAL